jgi:hypothetical protein
VAPQSAPEHAVPNSHSIVPIVLIFSLAALAQDNSQPSEHSLTLSGSQIWTDTGIDVAAGEMLTFRSETKPGSDANCSPEGFINTAGDYFRIPLDSAPVGALIAKSSEKADPILVGKGTTLKVGSAGRLFLGVNEDGKSNCTFAVKVSIAQTQNSAAQAESGRANMKDQLSSAAKVWLQGQFGKPSQANNSEGSNAVTSSATTGTAPVPSSRLKLPNIILDADLRKNIDGLPRRVHDHLGNPGDMVNFVIVGAEDRAKAALDAADWHLADVDSKKAGLNAVMNTYQKKDYLEMPMSHLYLFDRMQDFGYEQAQAYSVVASRHHFRMWKAPFTWNGETVYVGAGTHDIGFEKDVRSGHLTHKIDPEVDGERENIAQSLDKSGKVKSMTYYLPPEPVQDAQNASGGGYRSDGRLLVVFLQ